MGTGSFLRVKRTWRGADHSPLSKCRGQERVGLYFYSSSGPSWPVIGRTFTFTFTNITLLLTFDVSPSKIMCFYSKRLVLFQDEMIAVKIVYVTSDIHNKIRKLSPNIHAQTWSLLCKFPENTPVQQKRKRKYWGSLIIFQNVESNKNTQAKRKHRP